MAIAFINSSRKVPIDLCIYLFVSLSTYCYDDNCFYTNPLYMSLLTQFQSIKSYLKTKCREIIMSE